MNSDVVVYHSGMSGPPQAAALGSAGAIIALLDACLVNGFNSISVTSLTRSGTVATMVTSGSNNFSIGERVELSGVDQAGWNDRWEVATKPASNTVTFTVPSSLAASTTGTISAKHPGAGWTKSAAGTNNAAYKVGGPSGLDWWLQVEDNNPNADGNVTWRARPCVGWSALDTATVLGEASLQTKSGGTNAWLLAADPTGVWLYVNQALLFHFGRFTSYLSTDAYHLVMTRGRGTNIIGGTPTAHFGSAAPVSLDSSNATGTRPYTIIRSYTQTGTFIDGVNMPFGAAGFTGGNSTPQLSPMPSELDGTVPLLPCFLFEATATTTQRLRGRLRGGQLMLGFPTGFATPFQKLDDVIVGGAVRRALVVSVATGAGGRAFAIDASPNWS